MEMRIRLNSAELDLIVKAMEEAGYQREDYFSDKYTIWRRFGELQYGTPVKRRVRVPIERSEDRYRSGCTKEGE